MMKVDITVYDQCPTLKVNCYADKNQKVTFQQVDLSTGRVVSTLERELMQGENSLTIPTDRTYSSKALRIIDADDTNIQVVKYIGMK